MNPLVAELVAMRRSRGMLLIRLAEKMRRHPTQVHKWEIGENEPSLRNLENWCGALGVKLTLVPESPIRFGASEVGIRRAAELASKKAGAQHGQQ